MEPDRAPNHLRYESSPYLLQHAHNPVDWYPWGSEAFARARAENKPIFLSIGYSTCHWCHVMARESFADADVAKLMNDHFIAIKVDREERPDIDQIYMTACQEMTGQGGWPLTILMTADGKPFFAGTYFPKRTKWGRAGLMEVLSQVARLWAEDRPRLVTSSEQITASVFPADDARAAAGVADQASPDRGEISADLLDRARQHFASVYDDRHGGFGGAPKFPTPHNLIFLLREWKRSGDETALRMATATLRAMQRGGIYDHLGYGFARYSTDRRWLIPHFEKMLYDNALLALAYIEAQQATGDHFYGRVAREVFDYVDRVMTAPEGGFYAAEDADSEGVEGKFYIWSRAEIERLLGPDAELFCDAYGVSEQGNFAGGNVLNLVGRDFAALARANDLSREQLDGRLAAARMKLFTAREERVHPHKDDKMLTAWNGLMIAALARGSAVLLDQRHADMARRATAMIEERLVDDRGRLLARYRDGQSGIPGYIDDYAFYVFGLHELFSAVADPRLLERAGRLLDDAIGLFWDDVHGGFYFTGRDAETLIARPKDLYDGALPSGNSVMALNLLRHSRLTGDERLADYAQRQLDAFTGAVVRNPAAHTFFLLAAQIAVSGGAEVVVAEGRNADVFAAMRDHVQQQYLPFAVVLPKTRGNADALDRLAPAHRDKVPVDNRTALYLCEHFACQKPLTTLAEVEQRLQ